MEQTFLKFYICITAVLNKIAIFVSFAYDASLVATTIYIMVNFKFLCCRNILRRISLVTNDSCWFPVAHCC